jgi:hypothetical protein
MMDGWTIAEALAEGVDGVMMTCPTCRLIVEAPLARMRGAIPTMTLREIAARGRCNACGSRPSDARWSSRSYSAQLRLARLAEAQKNPAG